MNRWSAKEGDEVSDATFLSLPGELSFELIDGHLRHRKPMGVLANYLAANAIMVLGTYEDRSGAGTVLGSRMIYRWKTRTFRKPDVSLVGAEHLHLIEADAAFLSIAPALIVEIVTPYDADERLEERLADYADAGVPLVWVLDAGGEAVRIRRADGTTNRLGLDQAISGEAELPGFACRVSELLPTFPRGSERHRAQREAASG